MSQQITDGFDLAAQLDESLLTQVFSFVFIRRLGRLQRTVGEDRSLELWFDRPEFALVASGDPAALRAEVVLRVTARLSDQFDEARLFMKATGRLELPKLQSGAQAFLGPALDFRRSGDADFKLTFSNNAEFDDVVLTVLRSTLRQESPFLVSPLLPLGPTVRMRSYFSVGGTNLLALFAAIGAADRPTPSTVVRRTRQTSPVVVLVPDDIVMPALQAGLAAQGLGSLPAKVPGRPDVELRSLELQLAEGHIVASGAGTGTKEIVVDIDVDFTFKAFLQLLIDGKRVTTHLISAQQQVDSALGDVLDLLTAGVITRSLEVAVERAVGSIFGGAIPTVEVFASGLPADEPVVNAVNDGIVGITRLGLAIPVRVDVPLVAPAVPPYLRGHHVSREFHVVRGCQFGDLISPRNLRKFARAEQAIRDGFGGCSKCMASFDVREFGDLDVTVKRPAGAPDGPVSLTARLAGEVVRFGVQVRPPPETVPDISFFVDPTDGVRTARLHFTKLVPGLWQFTLQCAPWSVTGEVTLTERFVDADGQVQGTGTEIIAVVGQPGFTVNET